MFTAQLVATVLKCCKNQPNERPGPLELIATAESGLAQMPKLSGDLTGQVPEHLKLDYKGDEYNLIHSFQTQTKFPISALRSPAPSR